MSQAVITKAFTEWKAQQAIDNKPVLLDEFIFAFIPGLDVDKPIANTETTPGADKIVHRQAVSKSGVVNGNSVVYSVTLGADVGDFDFNWIGLSNKATGTLAMIIHAPTQRKIKNASGQQGNVLVRSMLMEYSGAQAATNITTPAETWQIDFTARLASMDERQRLENIDLYGAAAFFDTGYLVDKSGTQYFVTKGAGYVAGLRTELAANQNIAVSTKPVKVWLDVSWSGTLTSEWTVKSKITVAANLANYVENGSQHYVFALASIDANGNITDLRPAGGLADQALKAHEKSRNHPDATTTEKGFTKLSSAVDSTSEALAATPKAVKTAYDKAKAADDNANTRVPLTRKINGHALSTDTDILPGDIFKLSVGIGGGADLNDYIAPGLYFQAANAQAATGTNYPEPNAGSLEVYKHAGLTQIYRIYSNSRSYIRTMYNGTWSAWTKQYDAANKPSPADINAVDKGGDTMTGPLKVNAEVQSASVNSYRIVYGDYGTYWRNDSNNLYLMLTNKGDAYGSYNSLRPFRVSLSTGAVQIETPLSVVNTIYADKDVTAGYSDSFMWTQQYNTKAPFYNSYSAASDASEYHPVVKQRASIAGVNSWAFSMGSLVAGTDLSWHLHLKGSGVQDINFKWDTSGNFYAPGQVSPGNYTNFDQRYYTKAQSDAGYMAKTGAYTKAESEARYQPKGNYTPAGQAYTKAESEARYQAKGSYVTGVRLGASAEYQERGNSERMAGGVMTSFADRGSSNYWIRLRPLQYQINGDSWVTAAYA